MGDLAVLAEEALAAAGMTSDVEEQIEIALACPCLGELKEGPCGQTFVAAFRCFIKSEHEDKGMDCIELFQGFQACLGNHPDHYSDIMATAANNVDAAVEVSGAEE